MSWTKTPICRTCPICGKEFWTHWDTKVYCSDLCKRSSDRRAKKGKRRAEAEARKRNEPVDPIKKCPRNCIYRTHAGSVEICDYLTITGEARGCPGGKECTRYRGGKKNYG